MSKIPVIDTCWECPYCVKYEEAYVNPLDAVYGMRMEDGPVSYTSTSNRHKRCGKTGLDIEEYSAGVHLMCPLPDYKGE
jgi:hypothetical protein